ncbi:MAG TPA: hypothetical protein PKE00_11435 [Planctomycetota bacterium]|nr:hypothetical protein [Planctomycetota bacterium]
MTSLRSTKIDSPFIARGLRVEADGASIATPSLSPRHASAFKKAAHGVTLRAGGGALLCSQVEMTGWSDWNIEVVEAARVAAIHVEWRIDGDVADVVRLGDVLVARGSPVIHEARVDELFIGPLHLRRLPATMPSSFEESLMLTCEGSDWIVRSSIRTRLAQGADLRHALLFRRTTRVSPELEVLVDDCATLEAGTRLRIGLSEVVPT